MNDKPVAASSIEATKGASIYPEPFAALVRGRMKRKLGDAFALTNFGVNLTTLDPGAISALLHHHSAQDEFVYVLDGSLTLVLGEEEHRLGPGDCIGFKAGTGVPHQLINRSTEVATYLEIGDRSPDDKGHYPNDDLEIVRNADGTRGFLHKDGTAY